MLLMNIAEKKALRGLFYLHKNWSGYILVTATHKDTKKC